MLTFFNPTFRARTAGALALVASLAPLAGCDAVQAGSQPSDTETTEGIVRLPDTFDREAAVAKAEAAAQILARVAAENSATSELESLVRATRGPHDEAVRFVHLLRPEDGEARVDLGVTDPSVVVEDRGAFANAFRSSFESARLAGARFADEITLEELEAYLIENDMQVYWPNYEDWDGQTSPVVTFDPMNDQEENVAYRLAQGDARTGGTGTLVVDEAYAAENPTWVVNISELPGDDVYMIPPIDDGGGGGGGGGGGPTCPGPPPSEPANDVSLIKLGWYKAEKNFDSWFNGGSEMYFTHPKGNPNFANPEASEAIVTSFYYHVHRDDVGNWLNFNQEYISNWTKEVRNQKLMIHEHDVHGPFKFTGSLGFEIPIGSVVAKPSIGFEQTFKTTEPIIYLRDTDRASYFLLNRDGSVEGTGLRDCFRVYKGGQFVQFTLPFILQDYGS